VGTTEELLEWKSSGSGSRKSRLTAVGIRCADHATPSIRKFGTNFANKLTIATEFLLLSLIHPSAKNETGNYVKEIT
jgi:hypothetical protein